MNILPFTASLKCFEAPRNLNMLLNCASGFLYILNTVVLSHIDFLPGTYEIFDYIILDIYYWVFYVLKMSWITAKFVFNFKVIIIILYAKSSHSMILRYYRGSSNVWTSFKNRYSHSGTCEVNIIKT